MIKIQNDGARITATDYWHTDHAAQGLCYMSGNAGAWRLLVPDMAETLLPEMLTGKSAYIEPSISMPGRAYDIVFDDGKESPFALTIDRRQIDRAVTPGPSRLTIWTRLGGCVLDLACETRA